MFSGKCLENVNVPAMDSRDSLGRGRFFPFVPEDHIMSESPDLSYWYWKNIYYPTTHVNKLIFHVTSLLWGSVLD